MVGTAIWWNRAEAERDAAEVGEPVVGLGPIADPGEVERLGEHFDHVVESKALDYRLLKGENEDLRAQLAGRDALLTKMKSLFRIDDPFELYDAVCTALAGKS